MGSATSKPAGRENLYSLLSVGTDADSRQLKQTYRKKALELHPDRNINNAEETTALFAKVQAAYDLLSDNREREWYDQHQLHGKYDTYDGNMTSASDVRRVTVELSGSPLDLATISGYFDKLKHEEQESAFSQGIEVPSSLMHAPQFGSRQTSWSTAQRFYEAWSAFSSVKDYAWEDVYSLHAAQDRKTRRKFEQENNKLRTAAKRDFNAAVKQAVVLLRQQDPRKPVKYENKKLKTEQLPASHQAKQAQNMRELRDNFVDQEWQKPDDEGAEEVLECLVCEETFETDFDLQDHNLSTKHKKALATLKRQMLEEDVAMNNAMGNLDLKKEGKAKIKKNKKKNAVHILTCGTCGIQLTGAELIEHKKITRHP